MKKLFYAVQRFFYTAKREILFAVITLLVNINPAYANALWEVSDTASKTVFGYFAEIYRKWAWIAFIFTFAIYWTSKDDKKSAIYGKISLGICLIYVLTWLEPVFTATLEGIKNAFLLTS